MPFEDGLFEYLDNHAGLSREVDSRIHPVQLPERPTLPAVTYQMISKPRLLEFEASFLPHPRYQFNCWAESYPKAKDVAAQVVSALDVYRGAMGDYTVQAVIVENEMDGIDAETGVWHVIVEAVIWYEE